MREIKFRIWDDQLEKMVLMPSINSFRSSHLPSEAGTPVDYEITSGIVEKTIQENSEYTNICNDMDIMQFTGLLDKNGIEIYEGDIVENDFGNGSYVSGKISGTVIWNNKEAKFDIDRGLLDECLFNENIEVIGNIYENPELIKTK